LSTSDVSIVSNSPEEENLTEEFKNLANVICSVIKNTTDDFTVGIFGDWGTGKTTLMKLIQKEISTDKERELQNKDLDVLKLFNESNASKFKNFFQKKDLLEKDKEKAFTTVWFSPWRFENEISHATMPLLVLIIKELLIQISNRQDYLSKNGKKIYSFLKSCEYQLQISAPGISFTATKDKEDTQKNINGIPIPTLQQGIDIIKNMLKEINSDKKKFNLKIILFIDDLDRCSPEITVEVLDSIKILLNIKGVVNVVGLNDNVVAKLLSEKLDKYEINPDQYLQKIIDLSIRIPDWNQEQIKKIVENSIKKIKSDPLGSFISQKSQWFSVVSENNPRQIKRLINEFIIDYEFYRISQEEKP